MEKLFIADDEISIREGIKCLIDWQELGFVVCGEAGTGDSALEGILSTDPALVLMDIRMPGMTGIDVIAKAQAAGFSGHFVILSGYSDFKYAQSAMRLGVNRYLTKPLDEDELIATAKEILTLVHEENAAKDREAFLRVKSKKEIIHDILDHSIDFSLLDAEMIGIQGEVWQIVAYESFDLDATKLTYKFSELFRIANRDTVRFETLEYRHKNLLLLCGTPAVERFKRFLSHYDEMDPEKGSPLDTLFIAYGEPVRELEQLSDSYEQAERLLSRRFFCAQGQHILGYRELPKFGSRGQQKADSRKTEEFCKTLTGFIASFNRRKAAETLYGIEEYLCESDLDINEVKLFMTDLYLRIKVTMTHNYSQTEMPFDSNTNIISFIGSRNYLYEIISYFSSQFEAVMGSLGNSSRDSVMDDILYYIDHNYQMNLKLETIASLFGYNSSYLGKVFNRTVGESFNSYVDRIRINRAIELLREGSLKVYEIAERIGYSNVDYFHKKFKKYVGESPAEYRKKLGLADGE